jgi:hypothetical protein
MYTAERFLLLGGLCFDIYNISMFELLAVPQRRRTPGGTVVEALQVAGSIPDGVTGIFH